MIDMMPSIATIGALVATRIMTAEKSAHLIETTGAIFDRLAMIHEELKKIRAAVGSS